MKILGTEVGSIRGVVYMKKTFTSSNDTNLTVDCGSPKSNAALGHINRGRVFRMREVIDFCYGLVIGGTPL